MENRFAYGRIANSLGASALLACAGALSLASSAPAQSGEGSVNSGTTNNTPLNAEELDGDDVGTILPKAARLLSAPRLDADAQIGLGDSGAPVIVQMRTKDVEVVIDQETGALMTEDQAGFRERIVLFPGGAIVEGLILGADPDTGHVIIDEEATTRPTDADGVVMDGFIFGGGAYTSSGCFANQLDSYVTEVDDADPASLLSGQLNTFGGLTINGGRIAFFAGIVEQDKEFMFDDNDNLLLDEEGEPQLASTDRSAPPRNGLDSELLDPDPDTGEPRPMKPSPNLRGIWASDPDSTDPLALVRLAMEGKPSRPDPDPERSFQGDTNGLPFLRVHPSDYGSNAVVEGSWFGEQRFSRVANIAMNRDGRVAFRGDIGSALDPEPDPILGIWAENSNGQLWRVFVEDSPHDDDGTGSGDDDTDPAPPPDDFPLPAQGQITPWIAFENTISMAPADFYSIVALGAPAISDSDPPLVTAYALLLGADETPPDEQGNVSLNPREDPVAAIIARRPGEDPDVDPNDENDEQKGFTPKILAIEGEMFSVPGDANSYSLRISPATTLGLPGLADLPGEVNTRRIHIKDARPALTSTRSLSAFHPRPAINADNDIAFMGVIKAIDNGVEVTGPEEDQLTEHLDPPPTGPEEDALKLDEAIWRTRDTGFGHELELIVREGDPAPVVVNGEELDNAYFTAYFPRPNDELHPFDTSTDLANLQAFSRPVINNKGEIVFIGTWFSDGDGDLSTDDRQFGRGIFLSRAPGQLECLVSSGDLTGEQFDVPNNTDNVKGVLTDDICRVPTPVGLLPSARSFEQVGWTDSGILSFTARMEREDTGADLGWGLFVYNTAEPTDEEFGFSDGFFDPIGPQLIVKTGVGASEADDMFSFEGIPDIIIDGIPRYHTGVSVAYGESSGGDATLHPQGMLAFGVNPDAGDQLGLIVAATPDPQSLDFDGDGVVDGLDNCPLTANPNQEDFDQNGIGDACEDGGGGGGECTDCLLCVEIDCDLNGTLLGDGPDYDQNGTVDDDDVYIMMLAWDYPGGRCDLNKDGIVDVLDLEILMQDYGKTVK